MYVKDWTYGMEYIHLLPVHCAIVMSLCEIVRISPAGQAKALHLFSIANSR
jgi:hypothetical protein